MVNIFSGFRDSCTSRTAALNMLSFIRVSIFRLYQVSNDFDGGLVVQWHMVTVGVQRAFRDGQDLLEYDSFRLLRF